MRTSSFKRYGTISQIKVDKVDTWQNHFFLMFDIDWACDAVLADTIDIVEAANIRATWFVTHETPLLDRLRNNDLFELGIHPNFNFLLEGESSGEKNASEVVDRLLDIIPEATAVRSHSMTQSSRLLKLFADKGLTHDVNHFIPCHSGIKLQPWLDWSGLVKIPVSWEDDISMIDRKNKLDNRFPRESGFSVFSFHPIHVFLNTDSIDLYESTRDIQNFPDVLSGFKNRLNPGIRSELFSLLNNDCN